jgi:phage tail sheath gpL-like
MAIAALDANDSLRLFTVGLADNGSNKAAGTITIAGTVTKAGGIVVWIGNRRVEISVAVGDTTAATAIALQNALADDETMPCTFNVDTATPGEIDVIAKNAGTIGNQIGLTREIITAEGLTVTLSGAALSGGTTDPDVDDALDDIFPEDYEIIVTPYNTQTEIVKVRDHVDNISDASEQRPSIAVYATNGTLAAATTLANQINSGRISHTFLRSTRTLPIELASKMGSLLAFEEDPAKPMNDIEVKSVHVPTIANRFSNIELETLLNNGVLPLYIGPGEKVQIVRSISTYVKNTQGAKDVTLLDIQTMRTLDYVRDSMVTMFSTKYVRQKKTAAVKAAIKSDVLDTLLKLEALEIVENVQANIDGILVEDDIQDVNRVDVKIPVDVVNGLHIIAGQIVLKL